MRTLKLLCVLSPALLAVAGCAVEKSENPLTPTVAGPIAGVEISAPKPLEPATGAQIPGDKQPVTLLVENASSTGPRPLNYVFEVATDAGFSSRVFSQDAVPAGDGGRTALRLPDALGMGRSYYWRAKAQDGANAGPFSSPVSFDVFTPLAFDKPVPLAPINNEKTATQRPEFRFINAPHVGTAVSIGYVVEVATNDSFGNKIAAWQYSEGANQTAFTSPVELPPGAQLFWHARAFDGGVVGPWSDTVVFRTPTPVVVPPPSSPGPGGSCESATQPINIIECRRAQFGAHMSPGEIVVFLQRAASDLNKLGGGPYGLLRKANGASCNGWSCDIICSGNGNSQKQWDVLGDSDGAQTPAWIGPKTAPGIRIDLCQ